jgi:4'-phosphopantetheinyl transferase
MLEENEVHVWFASVDSSNPMSSQLFSLLSTDERDRAGRFHFEKDRCRFVVSRGTLRVLLGFYLDQEPAQLRFRYDTWGKPTLEDKKIQFNLSHSEDIILYAITKGVRIGIDVEKIRPMPDADAIAQRFFSQREGSLLQSLPLEQREEAFFHCWTRKEAFLKAVGKGLAGALDQTEVTFLPNEPARLLNAEGWFLQSLNPAKGYVGAIAVKHSHPKILCRDWNFSHRG